MTLGTAGMAAEADWTVLKCQSKAVSLQQLLVWLLLLLNVDWVTGLKEWGSCCCHCSAHFHSPLNPLRFRSRCCCRHSHYH